VKPRFQELSSLELAGLVDLLVNLPLFEDIRKIKKGHFIG
tara:strand:+ start:241 stop:360 length:120 start_codon:yes stop_codon:yes gene_type:complete